jgi:hypothetical protein
MRCARRCGIGAGSSRRASSTSCSAARRTPRSRRRCARWCGGGSAIRRRRSRSGSRPGWTPRARTGASWWIWCRSLGTSWARRRRSRSWGPQEAKTRFQQTVLRFVRATAASAHPLVLFLDDLQWADPASLSLVQEIGADPEAGHLWIIGAYRDNEARRGSPAPRHGQGRGRERVSECAPSGSRRSGPRRSEGWWAICSRAPPARSARSRRWWARGRTGAPSSWSNSCGRCTGGGSSRVTARRAGGSGRPSPSSGRA